MRLHRKTLVKGISELVIILLILAIAIPAVILLQSWLNSQVSTLPVIDKVRAYYTTTTTSTGYIIVTLKIANDDKYPINVTKIKIFYRSSSTTTYPSLYTIPADKSNTFVLIDPNALPVRIDPGQTVNMIISSGSNTQLTIDKIVISIMSSSKPGVESDIEALGA
ncbi:MAG: hypothetical protein ABWJ42_06095 [Sulfolobales archaeon]